jgi:hypothetical protein
VVLGTAAAIALVSAAWAAIRDENGTIHGCIGRDGALRVIDTEAGEACKSRESTLEWSATGQLPDAFVASYSSAVPATEAPTEVADLDLPLGKYQVTATANVHSQGTALDDPVRMSCQLTTSDDADDATLHLAPVSSSGEHGTMALLASDELTEPGTVVVACSHPGTPRARACPAFEVGSITTEPGPSPLPQ